MLFESTKTLLRSIVQSLEKGDSGLWDDHLQSGLQCQYELAQMSRASSRTYKVESVNGKSQSALPVNERAARAIPHVKAMTGAIRRQDQPTAIVSCRAAISEMDGVSAVQPAAPAPVVAPPAPVPVPAPVLVAAPAPRVQHPKPVVKKISKPKVTARHAAKVSKKRPAVVAKRRPARAIAANGKG